MSVRVTALTLRVTRLSVSALAKCTQLNVRSAVRLVEMENTEPVEPQIIGWGRYFSEMELFMTELVARREGANADYCLYVVERCSLIIRTLSNIESAISSETTDDSDHSLFTILSVVRELIQTVRDICREWDELFDTIEGSSNTHAYHAPSNQDGSVGRPRFQISRQQLVYLRSLNFSWSAIARLLGVSRYTVYRRRDEFNLSDEPDRTMTDAQLEMRVRELRRELPTFGEALVIGTLRSSGHRVTRDQVRRAIHATDPINTAMRWRGQSISRRPYSVSGPNSLWHIGETTYMSVAYYMPASARVIRFVTNYMCTIHEHIIIGQNVTNDDQCVQILLEFKKL